MNDTQTAPAAAAPGASQCPPWCAGLKEADAGRHVCRTARTAIDLPGCTGYLSTRCIDLHVPGQPPAAVVHGSARQDGGAPVSCGLYVPLAAAEDLAALIEVLAHAAPDQHRELAAAVRAAAAAVTGGAA